jgi:hypothetical protein
MPVGMNHRAALGLAAQLAVLAPHAASAWTEPPATLAPVPFACVEPRAVDGDTLACADGTRVWLRGVDMAERGEPGWVAAREELQRRVAAGRVVVIPHHMSRGRIVGDVLAGGRNVGRATDAVAWSKPVIPPCVCPDTWPGRPSHARRVLACHHCPILDGSGHRRALLLYRRAYVLTHAGVGFRW